jgi:hypothetical protein
MVWRSVNVAAEGDYPRMVWTIRAPRVNSIFAEACVASRFDPVGRRLVRVQGSDTEQNWREHLDSGRGKNAGLIINELLSI